MKFIKIEQSDGSYKYKQVLPDGRRRWVDEDYHGLTEPNTEIVEVPYIIPKYTGPTEEEVLKRQLKATDDSTIRIIDDLVDWAITNGWEPPEIVSEKINARKSLRDSLVGDEDVT